MSIAFKNRPTLAELSDLRAILSRAFPGATIAQMAAGTGTTKAQIQTVFTDRAGRPTVDQLRRWIAEREKEAC